MTAETETKTVEVCGIADCHGIESFVLKEDFDNNTAFGMNIRAKSNPQRRACCYQATMSQEIYDTIEALISKKEYGLALRILQAESIETGVAAPEQVGFWDQIPNPELDPWR